LNYTDKMFRADPRHGTICCSPAAVRAPPLVLGAGLANNNMNLGVCWPAMA
jgi:hypothetical protein